MEEDETVLGIITDSGYVDYSPNKARKEMEEIYNIWLQKSIDIIKKAEKENKLKDTKIACFRCFKEDCDRGRSEGKNYEDYCDMVYEGKQIAKEKTKEKGKVFMEVVGAHYSFTCGVRDCKAAVYVED